MIALDAELVEDLLLWVVFDWVSDLNVTSLLAVGWSANSEVIGDLAPVLCVSGEGAGAALEMIGEIVASVLASGTSKIAV